MKKDRVTEIINSMASFDREKYSRDDLLPEMFRLQQEMVDLTFETTHASTANLRIWDVERHLEQLNKKCNNVAAEKLAEYRKSSKTFCNLIRAEISGRRGEEKAFQALQDLQDAIILKNVELEDDANRSELDAVVITKKGITVIEVKNTARDIYIDKNGGYYRTGEYQQLDCNIAEKIALKENLLRGALVKETEREVPISSVVVFTNNNIKVHNINPSVHTCFLGQLSYMINKPAAECLSGEDMQEIESIVQRAECKEAYAFEFNVAKYKQEFATVMAILEAASAVSEEPVEEPVLEEKPETPETPKQSVWPTVLSHAGTAAAGVFITIIAHSIFSNRR